MDAQLTGPGDAGRSSIDCMRLNPYEPTGTTERTSSVDSKLLRKLVYPVFVAVWIMAYTLLSTGFFLVLNYIDPVLPIDFRPDLFLFAAIGGVAGLFSWYATRLVALDRMKPSTVVLILLAPYLLVTYVALGLGPPLALLATIIFGSVVGFAFFVRPASAHNT